MARLSGFFVSGVSALTADLKAERKSVLDVPDHSIHLPEGLNDVDPAKNARSHLRFIFQTRAHTEPKDGFQSEPIVLHT